MNAQHSGRNYTVTKFMQCRMQMLPHCTPLTTTSTVQKNECHALSFADTVPIKSRLSGWLSLKQNRTDQLALGWNMTKQNSPLQKWRPNDHLKPCIQPALCSLCDQALVCILLVTWDTGDWKRIVEPFQICAGTLCTNFRLWALN